MIVDNGRSGLRGTRYREMLNCIRCGACLNVCPVYRKTGGAAYGPVYSGPMGAVLAPLLVGLENAPSLPHASSLCGACTAACPVKIPLHELLLELRRDLVDKGEASRLERLGFTLWSLAWSRPFGYRLSTAARPPRPAVRGVWRARAASGARAGSSRACRPEVRRPLSELVEQLRRARRGGRLPRPPRRRPRALGSRDLRGDLRARRHRQRRPRRLARGAASPVAPARRPRLAPARGPDPPRPRGALRAPSATRSRARSRS